MLYDFKNRFRGFTARKQALILTYHSIQKKPLPFPIWSHMEAEHFDAQMAYLAHRFRCVSLATLLDEMANGHISPYTVAITFDDGFRDNATTAFPILQRYRIPATIFLTADFIGNSELLWPEKISGAIAITKMPFLDFDGTRHAIGTSEQKANIYRLLTHTFKNIPPADIPQKIADILNRIEVSEHQLNNSQWHGQVGTMDWNEAKALKDSGLIEFGAHTKSHSCLKELSNDHAEQEISESKHIIERHLGPIQYFAYPFGEGYYTNEHRLMAIRAGYRAVFTTDAQRVSSHTDFYSLPRLGIGCDMTMEAFKYMLHGGVDPA